ncbi:MAG: 2-C-methyl-D-erythritol 4-phosphate cytidylyltransferase, partial [Muribaculaceae bacterium]|nr:2-C-methyl-D-erythritol 4-phosphate cytidylyltransferase [Muribaculaceae bacterium]
MKKVAIIVAGGRGTRFGAELPKQFVEFHGFPVLMRSIARFLLSGVCDEFIVVLPQDQFGLWNELCSKYYFNLPHQLVAGGETRFQSVKNALAAISVELGDLVAVHDGVRPLVQPTYIAKAYDEAAQYGSAVPLAAFPYSSSLRQVLPDGTTAVVPREALREVQTPQIFNAVELLKAYEVEYDPRFTDDATVFESAGHIIHPIEGDPDNIKITRPEDLERAESILAEQQTRIDAEPDIAYEEMVMSHYAHDILNLP